MKQIEERYISLLTDFGFKRIFGTAMNKDLLICFLNSLFNGRQVVKDVSYLNPEHVGDVMREYEASKMAYRDIKNSIDTAKREGKIEGKIEANTETAQRLLAMGLSAEQVAKVTLLPLKIIENLRNS